MTKSMALYLADTTTGYEARSLRGTWLVWDTVSQHEVEFDPITLDTTLSGSLPQYYIDAGR